MREEGTNKSWHWLLIFYAIDILIYIYYFDSSTINIGG